jgi:hypothetical protein
MKFKRIFGAIAALGLAFSIAAPALAQSTDSTNKTLTITAGTQFSVEITSADSSWASVPFSLAGPANWTASSPYNVKVVDLRGTGKGWTVSASASAFTPVDIPSAQLLTQNNTGNSCGGFCAGSLSVSAGVTAITAAQDIKAGSKTLISSESGTIAGPKPKGSGEFTFQEVVYYNGVPAALAAGSYTTTITLTLTSVIP